MLIFTAMTSFHASPRFPRGFRCASRNVGLKPVAKDLTLFVSDVEASAAAVFTRNHFPGAPIVLGRETIRDGRLTAIVANSKVSNVATGVRGVENARRMAAAAAAELGTSADRVLVSSTGVIGVQLPVEKIETGIRGMAADLQDDPLVGAEGIMTTDTHPKALSASVGDATITWVAKGSGMIEPNMATMLSYIFTDAARTGGDVADLAVRDDRLEPAAADRLAAEDDRRARKMVAREHGGRVRLDVAHEEREVLRGGLEPDVARGAPKALREARTVVEGDHEGAEVNAGLGAASSIVNSAPASQ